MRCIKFTILSILILFSIGCQSHSERPKDKLIEDFIKVNRIHAVEVVKYKQYTAIAFRDDKEVGFYLDQSGDGEFSRHVTAIKESSKRFMGGFSDKFIVEYITDEAILAQIDTYKTKAGTFKKEANQKCFVFSTGAGGIQYFDKNGKGIEF